MLSVITLAGIMLGVCLLASVSLLFRDVKTRRLTERVSAVGAPVEVPKNAERMTVLAIRAPRRRASGIVGLAEKFLRFAPDNPQVNVISWKLVAFVAICAGFAATFYGLTYGGWLLAVLAFPVAACPVARLIFGWERRRYNEALLRQIPEVIGLISRGIRSGIPLAEAIQIVPREAASPSREEFARVVSEVAIGGSIEGAFWKLSERTELAEYSFFAVTLGLQSQTGGGLAETLENLQDIVRKRVLVAKRGKALAAEGKTSAIILMALPFVAAIGLALLKPGYLNIFVEDQTGRRLLLTGLGLFAVGGLTIRELIRRSLAP